MAGEGEMFNTDVNSQNTGYDPNDPANNNVVGNSQSINTLDPETLRAFTTMLSQSNVPQSSTTLPPQYYYPGQQGVAIGQMSGPMGSLTTYSPGQALFPMSVLDAVDKENKAMRQKAIDEQFKPLDYDYTQLDLDSWNDEWFRHQADTWDGLKNDYLEKSGGDWAIARKLMERDGAVKKTAAELDMLRKGMNAAYSDASGVISAFESGEQYTDKESYDAAKSLIESSNAGGSFGDKFDDIQKARKDFWTARSITNASTDVVKAANESINTKIGYEIVKYAQRDAQGNITNMAEIKDMINKVYQQEEQTGLYGFKDPAELDTMIKASWEESYGADAKSNAKIPLDKYAEMVKSKIKRANKFNVQKITDTDAWISAMANQKFSTTVLTPSESVQNNVMSPTGLVHGKKVLIKGAPALIPVSGLSTTYYDELGNEHKGETINGNIVSQNSYLLPSGDRFYYYRVNRLVKKGTGSRPDKYEVVTVPSNTSIDGNWQGGLVDKKVEYSENPQNFVQPTNTSSIGGNVSPVGTYTTK